MSLPLRLNLGNGRSAVVNRFADEGSIPSSSTNQIRFLGANELQAERISQDFVHGMAVNQIEPTNSAYEPAG